MNRPAFNVYGNQPPDTADRLTPHPHRLTRCTFCDGTTYEGSQPCTCHPRGYHEVCSVCGEPMGNERRRFKRTQQ